MADKQKVHLIGHAHLDPVWLWRWQEGYAEIKATFRSALDRIAEYPNFIFTCSCAAYYKWVEENAPEMFEEIRLRVKEGRWNVSGGMWIQPDCNMPSGESFARHFLYSQSYFMEKFGIRATTGFNVDSFGHNASLPKLLVGAGIENYVMMRPDKFENPEIPEGIFWWEANDQSRVLTFRLIDNYLTNPPFVEDPFAEDFFEERSDVKKLRNCLQKADEAGYSLMHFYGVGNHGGGPTIRTIEAYNKIEGIEGEARLSMSSPDLYFAEMRTKGNYPVWQDELQHHASLCYSAHSEIKRNNRRAENRLTVAEAFSVMAQRLVGFDLPSERIDKAWQNVLFNQFHDIICGCSIREAYEDAREAHGEALNIAGEVINAAIQRISWAIDTSGGLRPTRSKESDWSFWELNNLGTPIVVFNPLSWRRDIPVQLARPVKCVTDEQGKSVLVQTVRASRSNGPDKWDSLFLADVPAMGWRVYWAYLSKEAESVAEEEANTSLLYRSRSSSDKRPHLNAGDFHIENEFLRLEIEPSSGYIKSLFDKTADCEVFSGNGGVPLVVDVEHSDTWGHGLFSFREIVGRFDNANVQLIESGPVRAKLRVTSSYGNSILRQEFILYQEAKEVEVRVWLDWREKFKLLKLSFPINVENPKATYDVPFGHIERPVNGTEEAGQMWFDVTGNIVNCRDVTEAEQERKAEVEKADKIEAVKPGKVENEKIDNTKSEIYGLAILNDGKYSFDVLDNDMRMTVANGSLFADHYAGEYRDDLAEYLDQGIQEFRYVLRPHTGGWLEAGVVRLAISLNTENFHINETYHEGSLPQCYEGASVSHENCIISALKSAKDGNGQVLRVYESAGKDVTGTVKLPLLNRDVSVELPANSVRTLRIPEDEKESFILCDLVEHKI